MSDLLTIEQAAGRLHKSRRWLQAFLQQLPPGDYYRLAGRTKLFTEAHLQRLVEAMPCHSNSSRRVSRRTGRSRAHISGSELTEALRLARERLLPKSSSRSSGKSNVVSLPRRVSQHSPVRLK